MELTQQYLSNGLAGMAMVVSVGLVVLYLLRTPIKAALSGFMGYRAKLDDYAFSEHKNRDIIYNNEVVRLTAGINLKNTALLLFSLFSALIHPLLFAVVFAKYKYSLIEEKLSKLTDFSIYDDLHKDDKFVGFFNNKSAKINLITDEMMYSAYILMGAGIYFSSMPLAIVGLAIVAIILFITITLIYNAYMYRINYKYVDFFRAMRLLDSSSLGGNKSLLVLALISFSSNFSEIAGFSVFVWVVMGLKIIVSFSMNTILKREDNVNVKHQQIENRDYTNLENLASYPNPNSQSRGYKFSTILQMKFFEIDKIATNKPLVHIDNYAFYPQTINRTDLRKNPLLNKTLSSAVKVSFEALDLTKQLMILGGMGSGKTELVNFIVQQVHNSDFELYKAITFNDEAGDFVNKFYRADKDIIISLFDTRASAWDIFEEMKYNVEAGTAFIDNLFEASQGQEKDFFNASAKMKTSEWLKESYFATNDSVSAWEMFFKKIKTYEEEIKESDDKTQSSILATIQIALDTLTLMYYQIVIEKRKTFTFYEYVRTENIQLFFLNNPQFESKSIGYMTGVQAAYIIAAAAKTQDEILNKKHLVLNVFDEFLSMQKRLDEATIKTLLTKIRKFLFCNILLGQYLPKDEKLIQDIDSSRYALITFNINDDFTLEKVSKKISEAECLMANSSSQQQDNSNSTGSAISGSGGSAGAGFGVVLALISDVSKSSKNSNLSYSLTNTKVILEQQLQSMPKYHHITFIPSEETKVLSAFDAKRFFKLMAFGYDKLMGNIAKTNDFLARESGILYLGYTPQATLSYDNKSFEKWDMRAYYDFNSVKNKESKKVFSDEKEEFIHYMNIKFAETVDGAKEYMSNNNLERYDINKMFENVEENSTKVQELMKKYSEPQRYELMENFFEIDSEDLKGKYEFCKEHNLIGCILGIFTFSEEFRETILGLEAGEDIKPFPVEDKVN